MATGEWPTAEAMREKREAALKRHDDGSVNEQGLALAWNIPRHAISVIRKGHLRQHWHWVYGPSKNHSDIRLTREGIEELKKWVVPPDKPVHPEAPGEVRNSESGVFVPGVCQEKKPLDVLAEEEVPPGDPNLAVVWRVPPNPRMLLAKDWKGGTVSIRVTSNSKFRAGMKINLDVQCVRLVSPSHGPVEEDYRVYAFKGKLPRFYGRW